MKSTAALTLLLSLFVVPVAAYGRGETPVTRVVKLLQGLSLKAELEAKAEEDLYRKFLCWANGVIDKKTASNAAADARIRELETYVADIEAGRIEFTSERTDLEKELKELNQAIESATDLRKHENAEFLDAEDTMTKALTALDKAILVLREATEGHLQGTLFAQRLQATSSFAAAAEDAAALSRAADLGDRVLSKGDAVFLRRLLTGDVPQPDWRKLNREATFKKSYKARSLEIQGVLGKMKDSFATNLEEARQKEAHDQAVFGALLQSQTEQKAKTEEALRKLEKENGARGLSKEEATAEIAALKAQVAADTQYINQTATTKDEKAEEFSERKSLRAAEIAAFSQAVQILSNDEAKDLLKKSYASQGFSLLQLERMEQNLRLRFRRSAVALRRAAAKSGDGRLGALALRAGEGSHFTEVLKAIDGMVATLKAEEQSDLDRKERCESDRAADGRSAVLSSRSVDESTDAIAALNSEIHQVEAQMQETQKSIQENEEQLRKATELRVQEHDEYVKSDRDDHEAKALVQEAMKVLQKFYADNKLMLVQQPVEVKAGEAPAPPPTTWDAPYGGKTTQATGVIAALQTAVEDIAKDIAKAAAEEEQAQKDYDGFKAASEKQIEELHSALTNLAAVRGEKLDEVSEKGESRADKKLELDATIKAIADKQPGCDFVAVNYDIRLRNRQLEIDGLHKAKAILEGAEFNEGPDPSRALKPGDSFLLLKRRQ